ncbi:MAG: hypothetical protein E6G97_08260 [Alphaproteobacteria bacterium]|nr:MAG: hypothetical protein E6G97_08260 [Alphaproteobacteria bacterium]
MKFVAIPVLAGLAAGTGALGAYVTGPATTATATTTTVVAALPSASPAMAPAATEQATPAKPATKPSCEQQTWPYLDGRCIGRSDDTRNVRVVMAPRTGEAAPAAATANLVTSDTVLRGPAANEPAAKKPAKRSEQPRQRSRDVTVREVGSRDGFKRVYSVHSVPSASGQSTTPVIVVRPLPLNAYSSR